MKRKRVIKVIAVVSLLMALLVIFSLTAFAVGDVSTAIQGTWDAAKQQIKSVVDNVVFPAIDLILAVLFFVKIGTSYLDYRKHGQFEFTAPAILFACLVFTLLAPTFLWGVIGM